MELIFLVVVAVDLVPAGATTQGGDSDGACMTSAEVRLLLSEKQLHLGQVSERIAQGKEPLVNFALKRALEAQVGEIAYYAAYQDMLAGGARGPIREKELER